jgi:type I restriction-modification system DNA methylase subunit
MTISNILSSFEMEQEKGLVWLSNPTDAVNESEILAINDAKRFKADAIYFRRFENPSHSIPQVYIYERDFSTDELVEIHTKLWSSGVVPLFYIVTATEVKIFNCTKSIHVDTKGKYSSKPIETIKLDAFKLVADIQRELEVKKFSTKLFDNGTFWEAHPQLLKVSDSPYQKLLDGLLSAKKDLIGHSSLSAPTISKLIVMGILVKYLEEKEDIHGVNLLEISRDFYTKFPDCKKFTDILRNRQVVPFFEELNKKFNGKIFHLKSNEKEELAKANLDYVAAIFDANIEGRQYVLWKLYAFNFLPIELISGIYEAFLTKGEKEKGVVYTPPYLVNLLIDECMPLYKAEELFQSGIFKVLDPSCGSGIFLVAALKRMVQWQAILNYKGTGQVDYPDIETVKRIVKDNLFGIDIEEDATLISIFSLSIALCDKLSPMQIWNDLRFDDLQEDNIRTSDFFSVFKQYQNKGFDLIIGNPPFNPPTGFTNKSYVKYVKDEFEITPVFPLNDDNIALFFWDKSVELRKEGGKICFILPSGAWLYNNNSIDYRSSFMSNYQVEKIFDFTHLSDKLFHGSTNVAVCGTIATDKIEQKSKDLLHIVVKRSKVAEERFFFEIDHYDVHKVNFKTAIESPYVWKCNLWGGGRLLRLINYLSNQRSLGEFLEQKKENEGWEFGEGYIIGKGKGKDEADWITNQKTVKTSSFNELGKFETETELEVFFEKPRHKTKKIFEPPHILIKESLGQERIPMFFSEEYVCFQNEVFGIHAPKTQEDILIQILNSFEVSQKLLRMYLLSTSARSGINKSAFPIYSKDIKNLPYPENPEDLLLSPSEQAVQDDMLDYYIKSNANSTTSPLNQDPTEPQLQEYGQLFCDILNPIYEQKESKMKWFARGYKTDGSLTMYVFCYGIFKNGILPSIFDDGLKGIESLIYNQTQRNVQINRVLREYLHIEGYDVLILIKPKSLRYWLKSIALRDADETFSDLKISGF